MVPLTKQTSPTQEHASDQNTSKEANAWDRIMVGYPRLKSILMESMGKATAQGGTVELKTADVLALHEAIDRLINSEKELIEAHKRLKQLAKQLVRARQIYRSGGSDPHASLQEAARILGIISGADQKATKFKRQILNEYLGLIFGRVGNSGRTEPGLFRWCALNRIKKKYHISTYETCREILQSEIDHRKQLRRERGEAVDSLNDLLPSNEQIQSISALHSPCP